MPCTENPAVRQVLRAQFSAYRQGQDTENGFHHLVVHIVLGVPIPDVHGHHMRQLILALVPTPALDGPLQPTRHMQDVAP